MTNRWADNWQYSGDVNVEYGGLFVNTNRQDFKWGYLDCTCVTDLDSGCGFRGAVLIEKVTALVGNLRTKQDKNYLKAAMQCCGQTARDLLKIKGPDAKRAAIAEMLVSYGRYDPREDVGPVSIVIQTEADGPMVFDGWKASLRIKSKDLRGYIEKLWLR